jgi:hypothetical protein
MKWIELYIHEVTRKLPENTRQDIALELRSTIEDMLPDDPTEAQVKAVLAELGNPAVMAHNYLDRPMHLIGPKYFDLYLHLLKLIIPIVLTITLIATVADAHVLVKEDEAIITILLNIFGMVILTLVSTAMQIAFWITLIFAVIEWTDKSRDQAPLTMNMKKWTPDDLKDINPVPKKKVISKWMVIGSLLWTAIWSTVYFNAAKLVGIYEESEQGYIFHIPAFHQETLNSYWPLVILVIALEIALALYKFFEGQWTMKVAGLNTLAHIISLVVLAIIMGDSSIWNAGFIEYIQGAMNTNSNINDWAYQSIIIVFVVFAAIDIFEGYRKARIPHFSS